MLFLYIPLKYFSVSSQQHADQSLRCSRHWIKMGRDFPWKCISSEQWRINIPKSIVSWCCALSIQTLLCFKCCETSVEAWAMTSGLDAFANLSLISVQKILQATSCHLLNFFFKFYLPYTAWFVLLITLDQQKVCFKIFRVSSSGRLLFQVFSLFREIFALKLPHRVKNDRKAKWCSGMDLTARLDAQLRK